MGDFLNIRHPYFRPLWVRLVITGVALGWALFEFLAGNPGWALIFGAAGGWCFYEFFVVFDPANYEEPKDD